MKKQQVLFIHGAGQGAYDEDRILATSLQQTLGVDYQVALPRMPNEDSPEYALWSSQIDRELASLDRKIILVGHSLGGSVLLKYLSEEKIEHALAGLFLIAAPYWGGDEDWRSDTFALREDFAARLPHIPRIYLYHSRDDQIVPFAHLALYAEQLPQATIRAFESRGHQFDNDLSEVGADIKTGDTTTT